MYVNQLIRKYDHWELLGNSGASLMGVCGGCYTPEKFEKPRKFGQTK